MGLAPNLTDITTCRTSRLPPGPDRLLLGDGLAFAVDLGPSLDGPDVVGVLQEELLPLAKLKREVEKGSQTEMSQWWVRRSSSAVVILASAR